MDIFERKKRIRWVYLIVGVVLLLFLGLIYAWSVFRVPIEKEFGWSASKTSMTFSISMMMFCLGGLFSGILTGKKGARVTQILCAIFLAAGFIGASRIQTLMGLYITYGVLCGFGVGLGYNSTISTVVKWFPDKQGLISGITLMGFGFGSMILGTAGASMITRFGWRSTFVMFGIAFAVIVLIGAFLLHTADNEFIEQISKSLKANSQSVEEIDYREMLKRRNFWLYFIWAIVLSAAGLAIINSSTGYAQQILGGNLTRAAAIAGLVSIFNGIGRVAFGQLFDSTGYRVTMFSVCAMNLAAAGVLIASWQTKNPAVLIVAFAAIGLGYGGVTPTNSAFTALFFGRKNYSLNFSITNLNLIIASYLGPLCGSGSYMRTFKIIILFSVIAAVITMGIRRPAKK